MVQRPSSPATKAADPKPLAPKPAAAAGRPPRQLRFKRNDVVRFRKRSQIAAVTSGAQFDSFGALVETRTLEAVPELGG